MLSLRKNAQMQASQAEAQTVGLQQAARAGSRRAFTSGGC